MKKTIKYIFPILILAFLWGCEKDNYPGGSISPYIAIFDIRNLYKGQDVTLTTDNMFGSNKLAAMVVSDHRGGNMPEGLLIVQDSRRLGQLRGISIPIGGAAADYLPGDSVVISIEGAVLKRIGGILQLTGITPADITKVSSGNTIPVNRIPNNLILADPGKYESTLGVIVKGGFDPMPAPTDVLSGDLVLNDSFGEIMLHTEASATFADSSLKVMANYTGIIFNTIGGDGQLVPHLRLRRGDDVTELSSVIETTPAVITGFMSDVRGGDGNYEYIQLLATRDIDFAATPFAVVVTNNANASTPTGYPARGWATGSMRTYKFSLSSGRAAKGTFFYVGGAGKMINGANSTSMIGSNWIRAFDYTKINGDGFGNMTGGLFANSGNASGVAVFADSAVTADSRPIDVIFVSTGGSLSNGTIGYRIANTDWYDVRNPITLQNQPFYRDGSNTLCLVYNTADLGYFNMLGGEYDPALGRWMRARTQNNVLLTKTSAITEIEGEGATKLR